jgi:RimJ/RimL family protein N-acetyltransferase
VLLEGQKGDGVTSLRTARLRLEPQTAAHAAAIFRALGDPEIYRYLDQAPPTSLESLRDRFARLESRTSADGREHWLNWVIVPHGEEPVGYVQATVQPDGAAWVAFVLAPAHQGRSYAREATEAMIAHLAAEYGAARFLASVEAGNGPSVRLLERLGFREADAAERRGHDLTATERLLVRDATGPD